MNDRTRPDTTTATPARKPLAGVWRPAFLDAVAKGVAISTAARLVGVTRSTAYEARQKNPDFAKAWDDAVEQACDALEQEALIRALQGWDEPVYGSESYFDDQGRKCHRTVQVGTVRKRSDRMIIFLLQNWRRDKYGPRIKIETDQPSLVDEEIERLARELQDRAQRAGRGQPQ